MLRYIIRNNFSTGETVTFSGVTYDYVSGNTDCYGCFNKQKQYRTASIITDNTKNLIIPISQDFFPMDNSEEIQNVFVKNEVKKNINKIIDGEKTKYINNNLRILFKTYNTLTNTYGITYNNLDLGSTTSNSYKKSFFRLYFYDSNNEDTQKLLFTEDLFLNNSVTPEFVLSRIFWLRNDELFNENVDRVVYLKVSFFNARTGVVSDFINTPPSVTTSISITTYSNSNNLSWRTSPIIIKNPRLNDGNFNFYPLNGVGSNTQTTITLTELKLS